MFNLLHSFGHFNAKEPHAGIQDLTVTLTAPDENYVSVYQVRQGLNDRDKLVIFPGKIIAVISHQCRAVSCCSFETISVNFGVALRVRFPFQLF